VIAKGVYLFDFLKVGLRRGSNRLLLLAKFTVVVRRLHRLSAQNNREGPFLGGPSRLLGYASAQYTGTRGRYLATGAGPLGAIYFFITSGE
jgi:hypothetical protein